MTKNRSRLTAFPRRTGWARRVARWTILGAAISPLAARADPMPFPACLDGLVTQAEAAGVPRPLADAQLRTLTADDGVIAATQNQAEFVRPVWAYLEASVTDAKIEEGRRLVVLWSSTLDAIEARYGVDRYTLVAFWGVESSYGAVLDDPSIVRPAIRSLATLACGDPARGAYWRGELMAALQILAAGDVTSERLTGSWAGALGNTQFMPSVFLDRAVDFDGDGKRDLWGSVADALASTANYLVAAGWRRGERWGSEASLPAGFDPALADETTTRKVAEWRALGVTPVHPEGIGDDHPATLYLPAGIRGPAFLLLPNFSVILRYNTAFAYALTVAHLSDRLRGEAGFAKDWPRGDRMLANDERRDLQNRLFARGFLTAGIDGKIGPRTRAALRAYQTSVGVPADGYADAEILERLRAGP